MNTVSSFWNEGFGSSNWEQFPDTGRSPSSGLQVFSVELMNLITVSLYHKIDIISNILKIFIIFLLFGGSSG